jgi:hypothetical protein
MANINPVRLPVEYIYLDGPGIESLYAQIVDTVETSHTTTTQKGIAAKVGAGLRLKNFLVKLLSGLEGEGSTEVTGSRARTEQSTRVQTVEYRLASVLDFLSKSGEDCFFTSLGEASRHLQTADGPVFINVQDGFNAPQFYGGALGSDSVNADGYLLLEKGGASDYCYGDNYYKQSTAVVKLSASISKMRTGGAMSATSHEAVFIRGFGGRHVPLCVFGTLSGTSDYLQIKPFAIWK